MKTANEMGAVILLPFDLHQVIRDVKARTTSQAFMQDGPTLPECLGARIITALGGAEVSQGRWVILQVDVKNPAVVRIVVEVQVNLSRPNTGDLLKHRAFVLHLCELDELTV